jgi:uncharacterized protein (DUF58 family)
MTDQIFRLQEIKEVENLDLLARQVVEGFIIGLHKSPFHGFSVEFAEHRLYNQGESTRNIDWKVYARTDRMYTKRYEEETNLRCQLVLDASSSMYFPDEKGKMNKLRFSALSIAALMELLKRQRDAFGLSIFGEEVELHTGAKSNITHKNLLLNYLVQRISNPPSMRKTSTAKCLHQIAENTHKRSLVIIFSDMLGNIGGNSEEGAELFSALQHLRHAKHEVILFHVVDKQKELDFDFDNRPYIFVDMESGEELKLNASQVKDHYVTRMKAFEQELKLRCGQFNIDFVEADINQDFRQVLMPYLVKRNKM